MKGYKELSALPFSRTITHKCDKKMGYSGERAVYTAEVCNTKKGAEVLVVCLYTEREKENEWTIKERHFLNESGEMAGEQFLKTGVFKQGNFLIGNGGIAWGLSYWGESISNKLLFGYSGYVFPHGRADSIIKGFLERHDAFSGWDMHERGWRSPRYMLEWLAMYQKDLFDTKARAAEQRSRERVRELMARFGEPPEEVRKWVFNERLTVFPWFYQYNHRKVQYGKCAACGKNSELEGVRGRKRMRCPKCGAEIECVNADSVNFKHGPDKAKWDSSMDIVYHQVLGQGQFLSRYFIAGSSYIFDIKSAEIIRRDNLFESRRDLWSFVDGRAVIDQIYEQYGDRWGKRQVRYSRYCGLGESYPGNISEVLIATGYRRLLNMDITALCGKWNRHIVELLNGIAREPVAENIAKAGLYKLAEQIILSGSVSVGVCDSKKPYKFLGISRNVIPAFAEIDIDRDRLKSWRYLNLTEKDVGAFCGLCELRTDIFLTVGAKISTYRLTIGRVNNYLRKQAERCKRDIDDTATLWIDYIGMARKLDIDFLQDRELLFPPDIGKEHDRFTKLVEVKETEERQKGLAERTALLDTLEWSDEQFLIRPLRTVDEFITESRVLDHCVKTYIDKHISGTDNIFALRKTNEPDKPFFTVDISCVGKLKQNHGLHNCVPTKEVNAFVNKWLKVVGKRLEKCPISREAVDNQQNRIGA